MFAFEFTAVLLTLDCFVLNSNCCPCGLVSLFRLSTFAGELQKRERIAADDRNKWDTGQERHNIGFLNGFLAAGEALLSPSN